MNRYLTSLTVASCLALTACGGDDDKADKADSAAQKAEAAPAKPDTTTTGGAAGPALTLDGVRSCLKAAGLAAVFTKEPQPGQQGYLKVPLGQGQFEDPAADGAFKFFGHVLVYDTAANAKLANDVNTDRFMTGEQRQNAFVGFNTDEAKVPATKNGDKFLTCVQGS